MEVEFTELRLPEIKNKMSGLEYAKLKADLVTIMMGQRLDTFEAQASPEGPWAEVKGVDEKLASIRKDYRKELEDIKSGKRKRLSKKAKAMRDKDKILIKSGILRASFSGSSTSIEIFEDDIKIFTNVEYAARMNWGWKDETPARRFDLFTAEQEEEITMYIEKYLNGN